MTERPFKKVVVVGAGPSGLLLALLLSQHGIEVQILEASDVLDNQPRAAYYGPAAIPDLHRAGIMEEVRRRGISPTKMGWRLPEDHKIITLMDTAVLDDVNGIDIRTACLVLNDLDQLMLERYLERKGDIKWQHKVVAIGQDENKAWVDAETPEEKVRVEADYIVGCDGANSIIRRGLFGDEYPGFTWDKQIVATNYGFSDSNFIIHPEHFFVSCPQTQRETSANRWKMAARMTEDNLYRVTYGEAGGLTRAELEARQPMKFETMLPGHPKPGDYKLVNFAPYRMHQRCAPSFRVGRFLLAADAAHLCNPWGGLGITGGFVDVGGLFDCLAGIYDGKADESILDLYSKIRMEKWKTIIDPISQENFRRVHDSDPKTRLERDPFMKECVKAEKDKKYAKELFMGTLGVRYDFTQHYKADSSMPASVVV
ncbi:FAD binding domain-containing protein [Coniochaeta sp. 2T2.1]|nr:FAD binding domain-containing protein [Coniochaeta sp. 2T2.1]